jgi:hypothetical protein
MSIEVHSVQRIRGFQEATFGADSSGSAGSFTDLPIVEGSATVTVTRDELDPGQLVQSRLEGRERVLGKRSATLSFQLNLAPTGTAAASGVSAVTSALGLVLKNVMGAEVLGTGSAASTGSTASVVNVSVGTGTRWANPGTLMGWANAAGVVEWREVESRSTDAITLKRGFSGSPANGNTLFQAATYHFTENVTTSMAFIVEGLESDDRWLLTGCQAVGGMTIALDLTGGAIPRVTFNFTAARWYASDETSSGLTGTLGTATYSAYNPIVGETGNFEVWTVGAATFSTAQSIHVSALAFEPQATFIPYTSPNGINTIRQWVAARNMDAPVQGSFTLPYESNVWFNHRNNRSDLACQYVAGVAAGSAVILSCPTIQILNPQRQADAAGLAAQVIMFKGRRDTDVGVTTTDVAKSPFRIHLG